MPALCQEPIGQIDFLKQIFNFNKNLITFKEMSTSNRFFSALRLNNTYFHYQEKLSTVFAENLRIYLIFQIFLILNCLWLGKLIFVKLNVLTCMLSNFILHIIF